MKFIASFILMAVLSFAACMYFEWWSIAIVCFVVAASLRQRPAAAFLTGFLSLFVLWAGLSLWISHNNAHLLAHKMSVVLLKVDNPYALFAITGLIGALVGGFAALTGGLIFRRPVLN